jgi:hypothetical protein
MMGLRGCKGGNEIECLSRNARRLVRLSPKEIKAAKRSFWKRTRKSARRQTWNETNGQH